MAQNFKKVSQVEILKLEHCGFSNLVAYLYPYKILLFIFQISLKFEINKK